MFGLLFLLLQQNQRPLRRKRFYRVPKRGKANSGAQIQVLTAYDRKKPVHFLPNYKSVNRWTKSVKKRDNPYVLSWKNLTYTVKEEPKRGESTMRNIWFAANASLQELGTGKAFNGMCAKKQVIINSFLKTRYLISFLNQDKVVLKNLNGYVKPGQFLAIIGPSGNITWLFCVFFSADRQSIIQF